MARRADRSPPTAESALNIENPGDELGHLGRVINETWPARAVFSRAASALYPRMHRMKLRTPLTASAALRSSTQRSGDVNYYRDTVGSMLKRSIRLTRLVDSLLTMSRADAGRIPLQRAEVPVWTWPRSRPFTRSAGGREESEGDGGRRSPGRRPGDA